MTVTHDQAVEAMERLKQLAMLNPALNLESVNEFIRRAREGIVPSDGFMLVPIGRRLSDAPCDVCGYKGHGYYNPDTHPCAARSIK